jgi:hypothetical protein
LCVLPISRNTVTVTGTLNASLEVTIWGHKPYTGTVDEYRWSLESVVWSEGSLGGYGQPQVSAAAWGCRPIKNLARTPVSLQN